MDIIKKLLAAKNYWQLIPTLSIQDLESVIKIASDAYYNTDTPLISDSLYDVLVERLTELKPDAQILKNIGAPVSNNKTILPYWMGSMNKIKADKKIITTWTKKYTGPYVLSDKLDGISCLLTINNDNEITLYTRGNGSEGRDITHLLSYINLDTAKILQLIQDYKGNIAVRGELIVSKKNFKKYQNIFANARSMAAGIVNSKPESVKKDQAKKIDFIAYEIIEPEMKSSQQFKQLEKWGFYVAYNKIYKSINDTLLDDIFISRRNISEYEIDGIIVTDDKIYKRNITGNPAYSFAFKGLTDTAFTKVIEVLWKPSKDGILIPRVHFVPVKLSQASLEYTTGFNGKYIIDNSIGVGAVIEIIRSGDVIPYIKSIKTPAKKTALPTQYDYKWDESHVNFVLKDISKNKTVIINRLTRFVKQIGVESLSEGIITDRKSVV